MAELSIPGVVSSDVGAGRRPRNRKETISKVAATLFAEHGFDAVRMDDIAVASGITVRALYRHFANKVTLLTELVESSQSRFVGVIEDVAAELSDEECFSAAVERLVLASEDTAHFAVLWQREARHLDRDDHTRLRRRLTTMVAAIGGMIGASSPGLSPFQRELRAWASIAAVVVPRTETDAAITIAAANSLLTSRRTSDLRATPIDSAGIAADETMSRRERLLASAEMSFARAGFASTGIEDIGRAAGVSGPSLYRHFTSKNEILDTLAERRASWLWFAADTRWTSGQDPADRLRAVTASYIEAAIRSPLLVSVWITENAHVSAHVRQSTSTSLAAFQSTWSTALQAGRPGLPALSCARLVRTAVQMVDDTVRIRHLVTSPEFASELADMIESMLLDSTLV